MANTSDNTIQILRNTAYALQIAPDYQWGHMGSCNCGFLAREISLLGKAQIHSFAMQRYGDWSEQLNDYCPSSGYLIDDLITKILEAGFDSDDLKHLERLSDPRILRSLPNTTNHLRHNVKSDVVAYLHAWANMLEIFMLENAMEEEPVLTL